ncbi:alpha/beta fold hydrolase [Listeria aquatica]|uniref:alpha/beta fold hydrolase n=1 Tax=Listeria aquatica TaxID=1494960 RepID=UPI003EF2F4D0
MVKEQKLATYDGDEIFIREWSEVEKPVGIVQIVHGMNEHSGRYAELASKLNQAGYLVVADDHRGFGLTAKSEAELGHIEPSNGLEMMLQDQEIVKHHMEQKFPDLPYFIFAHSMGSYITRVFITRHSLDGVILAGSGLQPTLLLAAATRLASHFVKKYPARKNHLLNKLAFLGFNRTFHEKHPYSWLSRDPLVQEAFAKDPLCGPVVGTSGFFDTLFRAILASQIKENVWSVPNGLPVLLLSGTEDPVGHYGKDIPKLAVKLSKAGVKDVTYKLYEGARHELIHEVGKETVITDIINWIEQKRSER